MADQEVCIHVKHPSQTLGMLPGGMSDSGQIDSMPSDCIAKLQEQIDRCCDLLVDEKDPFITRTITGVIFYLEELLAASGEPARW